MPAESNNTFKSSCVSFIRSICQFINNGLLKIKNQILKIKIIRMIYQFFKSFFTNSLKVIRFVCRFLMRVEIVRRICRFFKFIFSKHFIKTIVYKTGKILFRLLKKIGLTIKNCYLNILIKIKTIPDYIIDIWKRLNVIGYFFDLIRNFLTIFLYLFIIKMVLLYQPIELPKADDDILSEIHRFFLGLPVVKTLMYLFVFSIPVMYYSSNFVCDNRLQVMICCFVSMLFIFLAYENFEGVCSIIISQKSGLVDVMKSSLHKIKKYFMFENIICEYA